jgi:hypothetical protein
LDTADVELLAPEDVGIDAEDSDVADDTGVSSDDEVQG